MKHPAILYILASKKGGTLYTGVSTRIHQRLEQHRGEAFGGFTKQHGAKRLVYFEVYEHLDDAHMRERRIKKWKRDWKIELIEAMNPDWNDLSTRLPLV